MNESLKSLSTQDETREKLLCAALTQFSARGIEAVKLSDIRDAAGQANRSVIHYHFKDRDTLVQAVIDRVTGALKVNMDRSLQGFDDSQYVGRASLRPLVERMFMPFWKYFIENTEGSRGIQFLSRMTWQTGEQGQDILRSFFKPYYNHFMPTLQRLLPDLERSEIMLRVYMAVNTSIHGLADTGIILADEDVAPLFDKPDALKRILNVLMGYLAGGLGAEVETD